MNRSEAESLSEPPDPKAPLRTRVAASIGILLSATPALADDAFSQGAFDGGTTLLTAGLLIVAAMILNALMVAGQASLELLRPMHVKVVERDQRNVARIQVLLDDSRRFIAACNLGSQLMRAAMIVLCVLPAPWIADRLTASFESLDGWSALLIAVVLMALVVGALNSVFAELIPRTFVSLHPINTALRLYRLIIWTAALLWLPVNLILAVGNVFTKRFGAKATFATANMAEEEIRTIAETAEQSGEIEVEERELLHSVFEFGDTIAREVMTPRVDLDSMPVNSDPAEIVKLIRTSGHSRIPLYEDSDDQIIGMIHVKDLLLAMLENGKKTVDLRSLIRPVIFIPENKPLHDLLREMQSSHSQMAIVQDEFGGTAGIVTVEDILEELVGEIRDEYDVEEPSIVASEGGYLVDGKVNLDDLNHEIGSELESEEFDTVGGYVFGIFGRQPKAGESIEADGYRFTVRDTDGRRILRLYIERVSEQEPAEHEQELTEA